MDPLHHPDLRKLNRGLVLREVQQSASSSRTEIAARLGLSLMAVTRITGELIEAGLIEEGEKQTRANSPGRRRTDLALARGGGYVIGITINAYERSVTLANLCGDIVEHRQVPLANLADSRTSVVELAMAAKHVIRDAKIDERRVLGIGVAVAGTVDSERGVVPEAPYIGWGETDVAGPIQQIIDAPVIVETSTNALLTTEAWFGACRGRRNVLLFRNAITLGGSLLVDGRIARGANLRAGQIGHMPASGRRICSCGKAGCLNTVASGWAVLANMAPRSREVLSPRDFQKNRASLARVLEQERAGDRNAIAELKRVGRIFGAALCGLVTTLDPEKVLLSGPVGRSPAFYQGACAGFGRLADDLLDVSVLEIHKATVGLALAELVFSRRLAFERLLRTAAGDARGSADGPAAA